MSGFLHALRALYTTTREMNEIEIRRRQTFNLNFIAFFAWLLHAQRAIQWFSFVQNTQQTLTVYCSAKRMQHNSRRQVQKKKHTYRKTKPLKDDGSSRHTTKICDSITYYASLFSSFNLWPFFPMNGSVSNVSWPLSASNGTRTFLDEEFKTSNSLCNKTSIQDFI